MTVQATPNFITYVGDNFQTVFNFTFRVDDLAWVSVDFLTNFDQFTLNVDQDNNPGGTATYLVAPPALQELTITRATPISQELDYTRYDPFDSEATENTLDKIVMMIQDLTDFYANLLAVGTVQGSLLRFDTSLSIPGWVEFGPGVSEFLLPAQDGVAGQAMITDGLGQLQWQNVNPGTVFAGSVINSTLRWTGANWAEFATYLFPVADGAAGQALITDGLGQLSFGPGGSVSTQASSVLRGDGVGGFIENTDMSISATGNISTTGAFSLSDGVDVIQFINTGNMDVVGTGGFGSAIWNVQMLMDDLFAIAESITPPTFTPSGYGRFYVDGVPNPNRPAFRDDGSQLYMLQYVQPPLFVNAAQDFNTGGTAASMMGNACYYDDGSNYTITLEDNGSDVFTPKSSFEILNPGSGLITIAQGTGTQLFWADGPGGLVTGPANRTLAVGGVATVFRRSSQVWIIWGSAIA